MAGRAGRLGGTMVATSLASIALLALPGLSSASSPATITSATMLTEGEYIGGSSQRLFHTSNAAVSVTGTSGAGGGTGSVYVDVSGGTHGDYYDMSFAAPFGAPLIPGHYDGAQRTPFREAGRPGINVSGSGRGCNRNTGRFDIRDIAFDEAGKLTRLWLVYEQHCEGGSNALFGEVLYKMPRTHPSLAAIQRDIWFPDEDVGRRSQVVPVFVINEGSDPQTLGASEINGPAAQEFSIRDDACKGKTLLEDQLCKVWVRFDPVAGGPRIAHLALRSGGSTFARTTLTGTGTPGVNSFLATSGPEGPTNGTTISYDGFSSSFSASGSRRYFSATVTADSQSYTASFDAGSADVLGSGRTYFPAGMYNGSSADAPTFRVQGAGINCTATGGSFTVNHVGYGADDRLLSADVSYSQNCSNRAEPLTGRVQFRAPGPDTQAPAPPGNVTITRSGATAEIDWTNPADDQLRDVIVRYAEGQTIGAKNPLSLRHGYVGTGQETTLGDLTPGAPIYVLLYAVDESGNVSVPEVAFDPGTGVEPQPGDPETVLESTPALRSASNHPTFSFASNDPLSGFECSLDSASFSPCTSPQTYENLADGAHAFEVRAKSSQGTDATPAQFLWTIDTRRPTTTIETGPSELTNEQTAQFTFTTDDETAEFRCSLDGGSFAPCWTPKTYSNLSDGPHELRVRAQDPTGNFDATPASYVWRVDTTSPSTDLLSAPQENTTSSTATFTFGSDDAEATFECRFDSVQWSKCQSPKILTGLSQGAHVFEVRAMDAAGNVDGSPAAYAWNVIADSDCEQSTSCVYSREVTLRHRQNVDRFVGSVSSLEQSCVGPAVEVKIKRITKRGEKPIASALTDALGKFAAAGRVREGARYVAVVAEKRTSTGTCERARTELTSR